MRLITIVIVSLGLVACARKDAAWEEARQLDTPDGYASYQERYPRSAYADEARIRREALIAERDWSVARNADTLEAYREYLDKHPEGLWAGRAKERVAALSTAPVAPAPAETASPSATPVAVTSPTPTVTPEGPKSKVISDPATPVVTAPPAAPVVTAAPKIYVQLGAFSTAEAAQKAWRQLQARHAALRALQPVYRRSRSGSTGLHLLKAGVASQADAEALCRQLQAAGQACLIS